MSYTKRFYEDAAARFAAFVVDHLRESRFSVEAVLYDDGYFTYRNTGSTGDDEARIIAKIPLDIDYFSEALSGYDLIWDADKRELSGRAGDLKAFEEYITDAVREVLFDYDGAPL